MMDEHEHEEMLEEEMDVEDLAESNQVLISALIEVLIKKGVLTQEEIDAEVDVIQDEDDDDEEDEDDEEDVADVPPPQPQSPPAAPQQPPAQPQAPPSQPTTQPPGY